MVTFLPDQQFSIYGPNSDFRPKIGGHLGFSACSPLYRNQNPNESYFLFSYDILHKIKLSSGISEKTPSYSPLLVVWDPLFLISSLTFCLSIVGRLLWLSKRCASDMQFRNSPFFNTLFLACHQNWRSVGPYFGKIFSGNISNHQAGFLEIILSPNLGL